MDTRAGREVPQETEKRKASKEDRREARSGKPLQGTRKAFPGVPGQTETEDTHLCTEGGKAEAAGWGTGVVQTGCEGVRRREQCGNGGSRDPRGWQEDMCAFRDGRPWSISTCRGEK